MRAHPDVRSRDVRVVGQRRERAIEITQLPREHAQPTAQLRALRFQFEALRLCIGSADGPCRAAGPVQNRQTEIQLIETTGQRAQVASQSFPISPHPRRRIAGRALDASIDAEDG